MKISYHARVNAPTQPTPYRIGLALFHLLLLFTITALIAYLTLYHVAYRMAITPLSTWSQKVAISNQQSVLITQPFLGINTALTAYSPTDQQAALARLHATGFRWVRQRIDWGELEPAPGQYSWQTTDAMLQAIHVAGLSVIVVLDGSPAWARAPQDLPPTDNPWAPPAHVADFAHFVARFAQRYGTQVDYYQIWDEPNIAPHWGNRLIEPVGYAQLLQVSAQAIRRVDGTATILSAALAPTADRGHTAIDEIYYLQRLYAAGAAPYFDVVAIQPLGFGHTPADPRTNVNRLNFARAQLIRRAMVAAGDGATPIWAVRYGWNRQHNSPWATVSETNQQDFATDALTIAQQQWPWLTAMAWAIDQPAAPPPDPLWGFSLSEPLATAFRGWDSPERHTRPHSVQNDRQSLASFAPLREQYQWLLLLSALMLIAWRIYTVSHILPWASWRRAYQQWLAWQQALVWGILLLVYYFATFPPLLVACWIGAIVLLRWQPHVGLWLAALLLPFHAQHKELMIATWTIMVAPSHALLLCLAVATVWPRPTQALDQRASGRFRSYRSKLNFPPLLVSIIRWPTTGIHSLALLWLLLNLCAAANIWYWPAYWEGLWDLALMPLLLFFLVRAQLSGRAPAVASRQPVCLTLYFVLYLALYSGGVAVALVGLYQWVNGSGTAVDNILRLTGPYFSPNHAALYLERTFFVGLGLLWAQWHTKHPATYCLLGSLVLVAVALLLTASRGAWLLGLPVGVVVFGWVGNSAGATAHGGFSTGRFRRIQQRMVALWHRRTWWMTSSAVVLIGLLVPIVFLFWARLTNSVTLAQRVMIWGSSFALWQDFFWVGVGPGGFFWRYPAYLPLGALDEPNLFHPHNLWLEVATGWGVWGLVWLGLLLWIISLHVRKIRSMAGPERWFWAGIVAAVAAAVAHGQVDAFLALPDLALWLWVILGTFAPRLGTFPSRPVAY